MNKGLNAFKTQLFDGLMMVSFALFFVFFFVRARLGGWGMGYCFLCLENDFCSNYF